MMPIKFKSTHCNYHLFLSVPLPIAAASTSGVRTSFIALFSRMSSSLKNKIKLVLLNYLLSAKSRWFSLREKGIVRICDQTLTHTDNRGVRARMHVDADIKPRTRKQIDQRNSKADSQMHKTALAERCLCMLIPTDSETHSQTLVVRQKSVICCLEDAKAGFVTFVVTMRRVWRRWLISVIYITALKALQ